MMIALLLLLHAAPAAALAAQPAAACDAPILIQRHKTSHLVGKQPCSCEGKQPGESDGCGSSCAGCSEPVVESCRDKEDPSWGSCEDAARWNWCEQHSWISEDCPLTCGACPVIEPTCPGGGPSATPTSSPTH